MQQSKKILENKSLNLYKYFFNREERNIEKSRYRDVIPGEATRVKLQPDGDEKNDFINANYVSGYNNQERAYIFTQGKIRKKNGIFFDFKYLKLYHFRTTSINSKRFLAYGMARKYCYYCYDNKCS